MAVDVAKRQTRKLHNEENKKLLSIAGVLEDLRDRPEVRPTDFLKQDYNSSPKFKYSPPRAAELAKIRFVDGDIKNPLRRSFVGTNEQYS